MHTDLDTLSLLATGDQTAATAAELDHISHCLYCTDELDRFRDVGLILRELTGREILEHPRPQVWDRVRDQLGLDPAPPSTDVLHDLRSGDVVEPRRLTVISSAAADDGPESISPRSSPNETPRSSRRHGLATLLVAAALALVLGVTGTLVVQRLLAPSYTTIATTTLDALPDWSGSTGQATLETDSEGQRWLVVSVDASRQVDGLRQVWLINKDVSAMLQVGLLSGSQERFLLPSEVNVAAYPVVDVSDEPPTDDGAHSGNSIVRGVLQL